MRISSVKYPIDIVLCITWATILIPVALLSTDITLRTILGLPFFLFIPGYTLIFVLFPTKKGEKGINTLERISLSLGFSIAITSLLGLILSFSPLHIYLETILLSLFFFIINTGSIAIYRWKTTPLEKRFVLSFDISFPKSNNNFWDNVLTIIVGISIIIALVFVTYTIVIPKNGPTFTEFYILGPEGNKTNYPQNLQVNENISIIIGLVNHEYKIMNYSIEVWLIDESVFYNESTQKNDTIYNHAWFMDKIVVTLNYTQITNDRTQLKKWEYNDTFTINKSGHFKLEFLLFTTPTPNYRYEDDYKDGINLLIKNAYRELHLWFYVR
jgi:uncharacterized membrane protein